MKTKTRIMTVDLEPDLRSPTGECKSIVKVLPKLLNFFDDYKIKATFFTVTSLLEKYENEIKEISKKHEIASHGHTHSWLNQVNAEWEIGESKRKLEEYGIKCYGFRAPKFITTKDHFELLQKYGYEYDSSFNSRRFLVKHLEGIKSIRFPVYFSGLSYRKLFYPVSNIFPRQNIFYLHPWEFLQADKLPKANSLTEIALRRNSGIKAWKIFTKFLIKSMNNDRCNWVRCQDWLKII